MNAWEARKDDEFAFFFEDDIEVSPRYFEYTMLVLHKYIFPDPTGSRSDTYIAQKMMGIALNTPRFNEIVYPQYRWVPQQVIGQDDFQFAFQLANSWGCLYFPWVWREYKQYYIWRKQAGMPDLMMVVPDSFINNWTRSWKKYLIELSYFRGYYMIYPNLPGQHAFSIHRREKGEHTRGGEEPTLDTLEDVYLDYFTIPLVKDERDINLLYASMKPLSELPVVNFHHERVPNVYHLANNGMKVVQILENYGFDFEKYNPNPGCILDNLTPLVGPKDGGKYLFYQPQGSAYHQLAALENAFAYAKILNRTLILPPVTFENEAKKKFDTNTLDWLVDIRTLKDSGPWSRFIEWSETCASNIWIDRIIEYQPSIREDDPNWVYNDKFLTKTGLVPIRQVTLPRIPNSSDEVKKMFGKCNDEYLSFRSLLGAFHTYEQDQEEKYYRTWAHDQLKLKEKYQNVINTVFNVTSIGCVTFTRGDLPAQCGKGLSDDKESDKLVHFRSCLATAPRTIEYVLERAKERGIALDAVFVKTDRGTPPATIPRATEMSKGGNTIPIIRVDQIKETLTKQRALHYDVRDLLDGVAEIIEEQVCLDASVFLGNQYSESAMRVALKRKALSKSVDMLGFPKDQYIF